MARVFVKDPASGKPAVEVTNYQIVEVAELEQAISDLQAQVDAKQTEVDNAEETLNVLGTELDALEAQLEDAKSELEAAQTVVGQSTDGVAEPSATEGTDAASSEDQAGAETPAAEPAAEF